MFHGAENFEINFLNSDMSLHRPFVNRTFITSQNIQRHSRQYGYSQRIRTYIQGACKVIRKNKFFTVNCINKTYRYSILCQRINSEK